MVIKSLFFILIILTELFCQQQVDESTLRANFEDWFARNSTSEKPYLLDGLKRSYDPATIEGRERIKAEFASHHRDPPYFQQRDLNNLADRVLIELDKWSAESSYIKIRIAYIISNARCLSEIEDGIRDGIRNDPERQKLYTDWVTRGKQEEFYQKAIKYSCENSANLSEFFGSPPNDDEIALANQVREDYVAALEDAFKYELTRIEWATKRPYPTYQQVKDFAWKAYHLFAEEEAISAGSSGVANPVIDNEQKELFQLLGDNTMDILSSLRGPPNYTFWRLPTDEEWGEYRKNQLELAKGGNVTIQPIDFLWKYTVDKNHPEYERIKNMEGKALSKLSLSGKRLFNSISLLWKGKMIREEKLANTKTKTGSSNPVNSPNNQSQDVKNIPSSRNVNEPESSIIVYMIMGIVALLAVGLIWYFVTRK